MADYDLRELSAPVEALRSEVKSAYERLDAEWESVANQLRKLAIPCAVSYAYFEDECNPGNNDCLEFRKWKGAKRLCIAAYSAGSGPYGWEENCDVTPYDEWSGEQRVAMLRHVPGLFQAAAKQTQAFVDQTKGLGNSDKS